MVKVMLAPLTTDGSIYGGVPDYEHEVEISNGADALECLTNLVVAINNGADIQGELIVNQE
jgi:hypothetical protein